MSAFTGNPFLSIVIVNWNTRDLLRGCLQSVFANVEGLPLEVFVVDNGSSDGSPDMVKECFPLVRLMENGRNLGFSRANNRALLEAAGEYCVLLNSDTVVLPGSLDAVVACMQGHPDVGIAGVQLLNPDGSRQNSIAAFPSLLTELFNKSLLRRMLPEKYPGKEHRFPGPVDVDSVIGACLFVRRKAMDEVGLMDEEYFFFFEETDWCLRFRKAGWRVIHCPGATVVHLQGKSAGKANVRARIEYYRSRYLFFRKHLSPVASILLKSGLIAKAVVSLALNFLLSVATILTWKRGRERVCLYWSILRWHARGCPASEGLSTV